MNNETCQCYECNAEIAPNMGFIVSQKSRWTGKIFYSDLCDHCWFNQGVKEDDEE